MSMPKELPNKLHYRYSSNAMPGLDTHGQDMGFYRASPYPYVQTSAGQGPAQQGPPPAPMAVPQYDAYAVAPPPPLNMGGMGGGANSYGGSMPTHHRASSGAWNPTDDQMLLNARSQGLNWAHIQQNHFPNKTPNACRKRHERLMERKGADDWDNRKWDKVNAEYMKMRKDLWMPLARRVHEKWNVVEAKLMANGIKNIQTGARHHARREKMESGQPMGAHYEHEQEDDSGVSGIGIDEELPYSTPSSASGNAPDSAGSSNYGAPNAAAAAQHPAHYAQPYYAQHGYSNSASSTATAHGGAYATAAQTHQPGSSHSPSPYLEHHRPPSAEMGIDALIHRNGGGNGHV